MNISLTRISQDFPRPQLSDVVAATGEELDSLSTLIPAGGEVAVAVGSRGIANLATVVRTVVQALKAAGAKPFIVPAMGSHGGATAAGQREVLSAYGIREETMNAPVRSSMEVSKIADHELGFPIYMDRLACESDGVVMVNRVKPHTDYRGHPESGLMKMSVIGLGKHAGALAIHSRGICGLKELIAPASRTILSSGKILFGIALVENAYDETMIVKGLRPGEIESEEKNLLDIARANMPALPTDDVDVLIIDEMGKDISGTGVDPNIIGRIRVPGQDEPKTPIVRGIVVTNLTDATHGNAIGVGLADVITRRLYQRIDFASTYENVSTSTFLERGKIPFVAEDDASAIAVALRGAAVRDPEEARIVRIKNTLSLSETWVSPSVARELGSNAAQGDERKSAAVTVHSDERPLLEADGTLSKVFA